MKYYHALYMSQTLISHKAEILKKIKNQQWQMEKYLIVLSKSENNHLEFFNSVLLIQKAIDADDLLVVGIGDGVQGAMELVEKITQEVYDKTNGTDIRNYILSRQQEYEEGNI